MHLTIQREDLFKILQAVASVVERRQTLHILANVLLIASENTLSAIGTDLEIERISAVLLTKTPLRTGSVTVSARKLIDLVRSLPADSAIELEVIDNVLNIRSNASYFNLATLPVAEFPRTNLQNETGVFSLPNQDIFDMLRRTSFAIAENNSHVYLNGLLLEISDGIIRAVAADAHRMSLYSIENENLKAINARVIVPKKSILEMLRLVNDSAEPVIIGIADNYIRMENGHDILISKLIDSKYPNYNKLVPRGGDKCIILPTIAWRDALIRVGILSNEILRSMRLELSKNLLRMTAHNIAQEKAEEIMQIGYEDANLEIGFNIVYLLDVLNTVKTPEIAMILKDSESGILIEEHQGNKNCLYAVMPFKL